MIGYYAGYKGKKYLVVEERGALVLLIGPPPRQTKLQTTRAVVRVLNHRPAKVVVYREGRFLVTGEGNIVSLKTGRWVWADAPNNGDRIAILKLAGIDK